MKDFLWVHDLDGLRSGTVGRQIQQGAPNTTGRLFNGSYLVRREIVQHDDLARGEVWASIGLHKPGRPLLRMDPSSLRGNNPILPQGPPQRW